MWRRAAALLALLVGAAALAAACPITPASRGPARYLIKSASMQDAAAVQAAVQALPAGSGAVVRALATMPVVVADLTPNGLALLCKRAASKVDLIEPDQRVRAVVSQWS
eukprot:scaffold2.g7312.t1